MTAGQQRALRELERLCAAAPDDIELVTAPSVRNGYLVTVVSIRIGAIESAEGGLDLHEREEFIVSVPPDFPFAYPHLSVAHGRFAGFPHVIWSRWICLFRQAADWNPQGGMYGVFEKLRMWLGKAALNDMDPADMPLEPPHHVTAFSQVPVVIRANAPVAAGEQWIGFALLERHANRTELVGWTGFDEGWPAGKDPALAIMLPKPLPMEFPEKGEDFFRELTKQGVDRDAVLRYVTMAAILANPGEPLHVVLGLPMRRTAKGELRIHVAVWTLPAELAIAIRMATEKEDDSPSLKQCRAELLDIVYSLMEKQQAVFCRILEDRPEITVARDQGSAASWYAGKRVLVLGCGALGSWIAETLVRAGATSISLVDNGIVKPGILTRQNYCLDDIGKNKAEALAPRLRSLARGRQVDDFDADAHTFISENAERLNGFDVVIDCTASTTFQMKLERDWATFGRVTPPMVSVGIDAEAARCIAVIVPRNSVGGIWDAYLQLRHRLCVAGTNRRLLAAFYSARATEKLFQPEPGCSEPTFVGSMADVAGLASSAVNISAAQMGSNVPCGIAFSAPVNKTERIQVDVLPLAHLVEVNAGQYRIRTTENVYREARAWVKQNNRVRSPTHETGGILWGLWDDAIGVIWIFDASGPPPDSKHERNLFVCGIEGTQEEHARRMKQTRNACGFAGLWHTHPNMDSGQSGVDIVQMTALVSHLGQNQRRALMLIFGRTAATATASFYVYESQGVTGETVDLVDLGSGQLTLDNPVV